MKHALRIVIEAGDTTCTRNPGTTCQFFARRSIGRDLMMHQFVCRLFQCPDGSDREVMKEADGGWPLRLPECLAATETPHVLRDEPLVDGKAPANPRCTCGVPWVCPMAAI